MACQNHSSAYVAGCSPGRAAFRLHECIGDGWVKVEPIVSATFEQPRTPQNYVRQHWRRTIRSTRNCLQMLANICARERTPAVLCNARCGFEPIRVTKTGIRANSCSLEVFRIMSPKREFVCAFLFGFIQKKIKIKIHFENRYRHLSKELPRNDTAIHAFNNVKKATHRHHTTNTSQLGD